MCDLGASINVMPLTIYNSLNAGSLKKTGVIIQLADRFVVQSKGVLKDILVQISELVFPADFYVLDIGEEKSCNSFDILLRIPFLSTIRANINVYDGMLSMEFDGKVIKFNVYEAMKYPDNVSSVCGIDFIDPLVKEMLNLTCDGLTDFTGSTLAECVALNAPTDSMFRNDRPSPIALPNSNTKLLPFVVQAPKLQLKELLGHLKYAYLSEHETLPVIISNKLTPKKEERLIEVLKEYKSAIGWTITNIKV